MKIGKYNIKVIDAGFFALDGGAMFGIIPRPLWNKNNPPDEANRIKLATRLLLLESESKKILIDTGMGNKWNKKSKGIYSIDQTQNSLFKSLLTVNIKPEDITDVILTHLHFDHAGGATIIKDNKLLPTFPNAVYHVQKKNFEWAINPTDRDKGSYLKDNYDPLVKEGVLKLIDGQNQFDDEIHFVIVNGHTFAQQLIKISDSSNTLLYCCDLFPTYSHIQLPYIMSYDLQPLITLQEKKYILRKTVEENWKLFFEHDPEFAYATVKSTEKGIVLNESFENLN
ncbi:MAG: MBL fold metallo-hydrolase [Bacteroidetes bacterium]|nr:MBL fold metallo-hydrolase [Bacteroidota bacterium]MCH8170562.1 MBL fold metallo-hydrolase [Bacteroidota bacterium]MCH8941294.1 MBL fold metallo-hydrolase [Bacteroidota bacterium]